MTIIKKTPITLKEARQREAWLLVRKGRNVADWLDAWINA